MMMIIIHGYQYLPDEQQGQLSAKEPKVSLKILYRPNTEYKDGENLTYIYWHAFGFKCDFKYKR